MEDSSSDIRIGFTHIIVLVVGICILGIILFYLGYMAGKSAGQNQQGTKGTAGKSERVEIINNRPVEDKSQTADINNKTKIEQEMQLHDKKTEEKTTPVPEKKVEKESYYTIQVGAFSVYSNAQSYGEEFRKMGYSTEILTSFSKDKQIFRLRVGSYKTIEEAKKEKEILERLKKKKFDIIKVD